MNLATNLRICDAHLRDKVLDVADDSLLPWAERTHSPIEWLFVLGLVANGFRARERSTALWMLGRFDLRARTQVTIRRYRVDVLLRTSRAAVAVELDGHQWHERTKRQAERDKSRDRDLLIADGITTIRFTGSEIVRDARFCAEEAIDAIDALDARRRPTR